jgi:S-formylglutathione hydrolase FrmB
MAQVRKILFATALLWCFAAVQFGQNNEAPKAPANDVTYKLDSKLMGREMPYRVTFPHNYLGGAKDGRFPVLYLLHGLTGHYNNWTEKAKLSTYVHRHGVIIVTPEGDNGWYTDSPTKPNDKYESYIVKELVPEIDKKFRTLSDRQHRAIAGLSMGGFGAIKSGLKYPEMFALAGSFSGALGVSSYRNSSELPAGAIRTSLVNIFGEAGSPTHVSNDIFRMIREASPEKMKAMPFLYIDCGTEDFLFQSNRDFVALLLEKKVPHEFRQLPGAHNWTYWDAQVQEFLQLSEKHLEKSQKR